MAESTRKLLECAKRGDAPTCFQVGNCWLACPRTTGQLVLAQTSKDPQTSHLRADVRC